MHLYYYKYNKLQHKLGNEILRAENLADTLTGIKLIFNYKVIIHLNILKKRIRNKTNPLEN